MYTILHISDLHRNGGDQISNQELLSSLVADFERSARETTSVTRPDAVVVSGDLVEGLRLDADNYPDGLTAQYLEAMELVVSLCDECLDGDRSRVVIIPGNHDVDWNCARRAFEVDDKESSNPRSLMWGPETDYRWSWSKRQVFRITHPESYQRRFEHFNNMYNTFYSDVRLAYPVDPARPWNLFELDRGNILVGAFNSCVVNDCFSDVGHIRSSDLAACHLEMRRVGRRGCLPVALWHHGVGGPPLASDYVDPSTIRQMIDKGFRIGLHGHRHDSTLSPVELFVSTKENMAVIGAGSLCSGPSALPHGVNRRYNVIQINQTEGTGTVHVREMNQPNIWGPGQLFESGGQSYVSMNWTPSSLDMVDQRRSGGSPIVRADEAERLVSSGRWDEARELLLADTMISPKYRRQLLTKVLNRLGSWAELKRLLAHPNNDEELAMYVMAAERASDMSGLVDVLNVAASSLEFSDQLVADLRQRIRARLMLER